MRSAVQVLAFLALVGAAFLVPVRDTDEAGANAILAQVTRHGFPVAARIELHRVADLPAPEDYVDEHLLRRLLATHHRGGPPLRALATGPDGEGRFDGLATGQYELTVEIAGEGETRHQVNLRVPGETWHARLEVTPTESPRLVHGRAVWADGRPFRGDLYVWGKRTETDPSGHFRLVDASGHATHAGFYEPGRIYRQFPLPVDGPLEVVVDEGLEWREGRVVAAGSGAPVGGARIFVQNRAKPESDCATCALTGHDGRFRIPIPAGGDYQVRAPGHLPADAPNTEFAPLIRLEPCPVVTGVVRTPEGRPVADAPVMLTSIHRGRFGEFFVPARAKSVSDGHGRFRIESLVTGDVTVCVLGGGWVSQGIENATLGGYNPVALTLAPGDVHQVDHVVVPAPAIAGRVLDHDGHPVAGIALDVREVRDGDSEARYLLGWSDTVPTVATDRAGRFRFPSLHPGRSWTVRALPWVGYEVVVGPVTPALGETSNVEVRLAQPWTRWLTVRVVEEDGGAPIPGASFDFDEARPVDAARGYFRTRRTPVTGPDGRSRIGPVAPVPLTVTVRHPTHVRREGVPLDGDDVEIRMAKGRVIAGRVVYPDGSPVAGEYVDFVSFDYSSTRLDRDGRFRRQNLPPGFHTLRVDSAIEDTRYRGEAEVEAGREDVEITLVPDEREPPPVEGPEIVVRIEDERERPIDTGSIRFYAHRVKPHRYRPSLRTDFGLIKGGISRFRPEDGEDEIWIDVCPRDPGLGAVLVGPCPRDVGSVTITVLPAGRITGRVLDPDGAAIPGARVFAMPANAPLEAAGGTAREHSAAYASSDGRFDLGGFGPGPYHVWATGPGSQFQRRMVSAVAGDDVTIRLLPAATPVVTVQDEQGRPLPGCRIELYAKGLDESHPLLRVETGPRGQARLQRLDPETTYVLLLDPSWERSDLEEQVVEDWEPVDGTFGLTTTRVLRGVVRDRATGHGDDGAEVWFRVQGAGKEWTRVCPEEGGIFEIGHGWIPWKPLLLRAGPMRATPDSKGVVERSVGARENDVELTIDSGPCLTVRIRGWPGLEDASAWVGTGDGCGQSPIPQDGVMHVFGHKEADAYLFHAALPDGRMAWATDLTRNRVNELDLVPGKEIRVAVEWPRRAVRRFVMVSGNGLHFHEPERSATGEYLVRGLPDGPYAVWASCRVADRKFEGRAEVRAGESVDLKLEAR